MNLFIDCVKAKVAPLHATEALLGERKYSSYSFSTSALDGGEWSALRPGRALAPGKETPVSIVHCWVGPRAGLDTEARGKILSPLPGIEPQSSGHSARSQTLYWLSYPAHRIYYSITFYSCSPIINYEVLHRRACWKCTDLYRVESVRNSGSRGWSILLQV
jgi:hypothetical protein